MTSEYMEGAEFDKYKKLYIQNLYKRSNSLIEKIYKKPSGHNWSFSLTSECSECSQNISLMRINSSTLSWIPFFNKTQEIMPCSVVKMRKALL